MTKPTSEIIQERIEIATKLFPIVKNAVNFNSGFQEDGTLSMKQLYSLSDSICSALTDLFLGLCGIPEDNSTELDWNDPDFVCRDWALFVLFDACETTVSGSEMVSKRLNTYANLLKEIQAENGTLKGCP